VRAARVFISPGAAGAPIYSQSKRGGRILEDILHLSLHLQRQTRLQWEKKPVTVLTRSIRTRFKSQQESWRREGGRT
jgi:hypothetical protein